jgi:hypothetical protein
MQEALRPFGKFPRSPNQFSVGRFAENAQMNAGIFYQVRLGVWFVHGFCLRFCVVPQKKLFASGRGDSRNGYPRGSFAYLAIKVRRTRFGLPVVDRNHDEPKANL